MEKVLILFNQTQLFTYTEVTNCLVRWMQYYGNRVGYKQVGLWSDFIYNQEIDRAIVEGYDYIFQFDNDMTAEPELLEDLLKLEAHCAGPLFFSRSKPHVAQVWLAVLDEKGEVDHYNQLQKPLIKLAINLKRTIYTDLRATGMTLFKLESLAQLEKPYGQSKPNKNIPNAWDGWDMDVTWKITKKFGNDSVMTLCDPKYNVKHHGLVGIGQEEYLHGH